MNNNGVENNQNIPVAQPVLTPIMQPVTGPVVASPSVVVPTTSVVPVQPTPAINPQPVPTPVVVNQAPPVLNPIPPTTPETTPEVVDEQQEKKEKKKKKRTIRFTVILLLLLIGLGSFTFYYYQSSNREITELKYKCSPISETREEVALDVNSTLVKDLYQKVSTSIREDVAQPEWNDQMRIYLAYRQIPDYKKYDSNCNYFSNERMEPYTCEVSLNFVPQAFLPSTLALEWKKLYGEDTPMPLMNVKLENSCVGGFEYIPERDEYVQGYCKQNITNSFKVTKKLVSAVSSGNMIILTEDVQYSGTEQMELSSYLRSGTYYYTFRLDMNYNYILISKTYDEKY